MPPTVRRVLLIITIAGVYGLVAVANPYVKALSILGLLAVATAPAVWAGYDKLMKSKLDPERWDRPYDPQAEESNNRYHGSGGVKLLGKDRTAVRGPDKWRNSS